MCGAAQAQSTPIDSSASQQGVAGSQAVHILVGHSIVIHTEARLRRILNGNPGVVTTDTSAPNELVVTATAPGSSSIVLWYVNAPSRLIEVFADVDVSMLRDSVQRAFPREQLQIEAEENKVVLSGVASSQAVIDQLTKMAAPFAKDIVNSVQLGRPGHPKQVLLKVRFAEVDRRKLTQLGINLLSTGAANTVGTVTTQQFGATSLGTGGKLGGTGATTTQFTLNDLMNIFLFRPDINLGATIKALQQKNVLQVLAEPNLLAVSGEPAYFLAGGELPYPIVQPGVGGQNTVTVQFKPFGVKLEFTGIIEDDNMIRLKVSPEVSTIDYANAVTVSGTVLPAISTRRAETVVELKDGQSFGIAGMLDQRTTAQLSKIPGIGDIPILGLLFKSKGVDKSETELLVIVTPSIVDIAAQQLAGPELPKMPYKPIEPANFDKGVSDKKPQ